VDAVSRRIDLRVARMELAALEKKLGLTRSTRFVDMLELAGISKSQRSEVATDRLTGFEINVEIPIFDLGETKVRRAEETYIQAVNRLSARAALVRSEARDAYQRYRGTYDIARHYQTEVLPLRKIISDEVLARYNGMITDLFQLLADQRAGVASSVAAINAERDYWLAATDLTVATIGGGASGRPDDAAAAVSTVEVAAGGHD
jgi:outer membrane protein TolC